MNISTCTPSQPTPSILYMDTASTHTRAHTHTQHTRSVMLPCQSFSPTLIKGRESLLPCRAAHSTTHQCWAHTSATVTNYLYTGRRSTSGYVTPHGTDPTLPLYYYCQIWLCGPHLGGEPAEGNKTGGPVGSGDTSGDTSILYMDTASTHAHTCTQTPPYHY